MLRPKVPTMPAPTGHVTPSAVIKSTTITQPVAPAHTPTATPASTNRPTIQLTSGGLITLVVGGTTVVLVLGAVLVSLLLAVAITAGSTAITALVIRSLMNSDHKRR
ncbi:MULTISPECIES: SpdD-like protein [unclassified Streptomyces]|uniref:SpdD-like protein n=1 Tax=unclassified Streptomyces TaxID=2593676 RepID=UPI000DB98E45|nr:MULTISPECIES: SpdD-like protein [unclassified Streptomyces]MYT71352.1 SpdD-like protein [Streptomyces sp. SID8367]